VEGSDASVFSLADFAQALPNPEYKDPVGVIRAWRLAKRVIPGLQLAQAGGGAADDPEGGIVIHEARTVAGDDPDIHLRLLPSDARRTINALQRNADIVIQKSLREGFGLTVTEALWKGKPVVGGDAGGIRLQVIDHHAGFRVDSPEGAALRSRCLIHHEAARERMSRKALQFVREDFLLTRHLRDYLTLMVGLRHGDGEYISLP